MIPENTPAQASNDSTMVRFRRQYSSFTQGNRNYEVCVGLALMMFSLALIPFDQYLHADIIMVTVFLVVSAGVLMICNANAERRDNRMPAILPFIGLLLAAIHILGYVEGMQHANTLAWMGWAGMLGWAKRSGREPVVSTHVW